MRDGTAKPSTVSRIFSIAPFSASNLEPGHGTFLDTTSISSSPLSGVYVGRRSGVKADADPQTKASRALSLRAKLLEEATSLSSGDLSLLVQVVDEVMKHRINAAAKNANDGRGNQLR
jgi:hypothetical protein